MPKYLFEASYTPEGTKGILKEGASGRRAAVEKAIAGLGGKLEAFYFAFGSSDAYVIADLPEGARVLPLQHRPDQDQRQHKLVVLVLDKH